MADVGCSGSSGTGQKKKSICLLEKRPGLDYTVPSLTKLTKKMKVNIN